MTDVLGSRWSQAEEVPEPEALTLLVIVENGPELADTLFIWHGWTVLRGEEAWWAGAEGRSISPETGWRVRLRPTSPDLREMFGGASEFLPTVIHNLPDDETHVIPVGWKLPE